MIQAGTSLPDQLKAAEAFVAANEMICVGVIRQTGVTGSVPALRTDIDDVIARKREKNDFDVLVLADISRLTRAGLKHGMKWEYELEIEGIEPVFIANDLPTGEDGDLIKPSYYFAARMWAKSLAYACTRGSMSALLDGRMAHCTVAPFGFDMLFTSDGRSLYITRLLPDGRQLKLHPDALGKHPTPDQILATYPANPKKGSDNHEGRQPSNHHRKQKYEHAIPVPGAPDAVTAVILIFRWKLEKGWGGGRIAAELNDMGIPAPRGGLWNTSTVDYLLRNSVYVGYGLANRKSRAIINQRAHGAPAARLASARDLAKRKTQPLEYRPKEEWVTRDYDDLVEFLGPDLAPLAREFIEKELKKTENGRVPKKEFHDRHVNSNFILKHILRSKQGGHSMSGFVSRSNGHVYRRYRISKAHHAPVKGSILRRKLPAEPLEKATLEILEAVLLQMPNLRAKIITAIKAEIARRMEDNDQRRLLLVQRDSVKEEYTFLIRNLGKHGKELAQQRIAQLEAQLESLELRIAAADLVVGAAVDPEKEADKIIGSLNVFRKQMRQMAPALLRRALAALIPLVEVDLVTLDVEVEVALPTWALLDVEALNRELCLVPNARMTVGSQAQWANRLKLGIFRCSASPRPVCFTCRRMKRAA